MFDETDLFFRMIQKFDKLYVFILSVSFVISNHSITILAKSKDCLLWKWLQKSVSKQKATPYGFLFLLQ